MDNHDHAAPSPMPTPSRRQMLTGAASAGLLLAMPLRQALAQARVTVTEGNFQPIPIAIPSFVPGGQGTLVYMNGGDDLAGPLGRVTAAGGAVLMPKTSIGPHGFIAQFRDSEGNRVGLHSMA